MEEDFMETKCLQEKIEQITLEKTKLEQIYTSKIDWYMSADDALKYDVIDEILQ